MEGKHWEKCGLKRHEASSKCLQDPFVVVAQLRFDCAELKQETGKEAEKDLLAEAIAACLVLMVENKDDQSQETVQVLRLV